MERWVVLDEIAQLGLHEEQAEFFVDHAHEVAVIVGDLGAFVGWLDVAWDGPATPVWALRGVVHVPLPSPGLLRRELAAARRKRNRALRQCQFCGRRFTAGHLHRIDDRDVCHGCAETELGVVH